MENKSNEALVMKFFTAMGPKIADVINAYETYFHSDGVWKNSGFPDVVGIVPIRHFLIEQQRLVGLEQVRVLDHRYLGSIDDRVFFERRDSICDADGNVLHAFDILGMFIIRDGRIAAWHDYMDTSAFQKEWEAKEIARAANAG